jgi:hypothetical protein
MTDEVETKSSIEGNRDEGHYNNGKDRVARQDGEIERPYQPEALKPRRSVVVVISEVRRKKERRYNECGYLTSTMSGYLPPTNKRIAAKE